MAEAEGEFLTAGLTFKGAWALVKRLVRPHPTIFVISVFGAFIFAGGSVGSAVILGRVIDNAVLPALADGEPLDSSAVATGIAALLLIAVARAVGVVARRFFAGMTAERAERHVRRRLGPLYVDAPLSWRRSHPTGELLAHVDSDANVLARAIHPLPFSIGVIFLVGFGSAALLAIDFYIALIALAVFPLMVLINRSYSRSVEAPLAQTQASIGEVSSIAHESFEGAQMVRTLGRAGAEVERFSSAVQDLRSHRVKAGRLRAAFDVTINSLPSLGVLAAIGIGGFRVDAGVVTPGDLVQVAALFSILAVPMHVFGFFLESLSPSSVAWHRLEPLVGDTWWQDPPTPNAAAGRSAASPAPAAVSLSDVTYMHPDSTPGSDPVIADFSLHVPAGQQVAIVGPTGSGKSTLCLLAAGLLSPDEGTARIGEAAADSVVGSAHGASVVFQEPFLFSGTVSDNIDLVGGLDAPTVRHAAELADIHSFIEQMPERYETKVGERGVTLSGGQRQRVAIARALVRPASVLLLDDATSALDPIVERRVLDAIDKTGTTVLVVAHRLATITRADRVVYLRDGRLAGDGSHEDLLADPTYAALVNAYAEEVPA